MIGRQAAEMFRWFGRVVASGETGEALEASRRLVIAAAVGRAR